MPYRFIASLIVIWFPITENIEAICASRFIASLNTGLNRAKFDPNSVVTRILDFRGIQSLGMDMASTNPDATSYGSTIMYFE